MSFEKLVKEIKQQRVYSKDTLEDATPQTIATRKGRKQSAISRLSDLFYDYRDAVKSKILPIVVLGSGANEFAEIAASSEANLSSLDADALYATVASKLDPRILDRGSESNSYILDVASRYLEDEAREMGISSYPQLVYNQKYQGKVKNTEEATSLIKRAILDQIGPEMAALYVLTKGAKLAFEEEFEGKFYPLIVKSKDEKSLNSALTSFGNKVSVISTDKTDLKDAIEVKELTKESVLKALTKIKTKLNKTN